MITLAKNLFLIVKNEVRNEKNRKGGVYPLINPPLLRKILRILLTKVGEVHTKTKFRDSSEGFQQGICIAGVAYVDKA